MMRIDSQGDVTTITIDNPPVNVLTIQLMSEMAEAINASQDKVLLVEAKGATFSAGGDVAEMAGARAAQMIGAMRSVFEALMAFEGISVAAVAGPALGSGCELVCLCDVVIAGERAVFGQPETSLGVLPPVASVVWPRHFGYHRALDLILTGRRVSAQEMFDAGLVTRVVPADGFEAAVADAIGQYVSMSGTVAAHAKRACRIGAGSDVDAALRQIERLYLDSLMTTKDAHEGLEAFMQKRPPDWSDA